MDLLKVFSSKSSKDVAKDRLKLILIHDRAKISPALLEMMKSDLLKVIEKYMEIDNDDVEVRLTDAEDIKGSFPALVASIPIKEMKTLEIE
ncbi:cell division topological specificity factor MinE [Clostridium sediminicola]|uniref:cell division topological specificity factor MinE n=1 Tax=Clostridium sediminicola TaxID=3114879 RepID=UPI0031F217EF